MHIITVDDLKTLMERQEGLCVSIFMPTHRKGTETQQNQIRYKNLLRKVGEKLLESELRPQEVKEFLKPAQELSGDIPFWQNQSEGLAIFISQLSLSYFMLPFNLEELIVVTDRFHVKPLIPVVSGGIEFYILAISQNDVRLIECTQHSANEVEIEGVPQNLSEALNLDTYQKRLQLHTGTEDTKAKILQFFQLVDKGLHDFFRNKRTPLIFAGVDYLLPIYREVNTYQGLVEKGISGNPEGLSPEELQSQVWPVVEAFFEKKKSEAIDQFRELSGTGRASADIGEIVQAAYHGRIGTIFVAVGVQKWGSFNPDTNDVYLHDHPKFGNRDLLDFAAIRTLSNGGIVYAVNPKDIPDKAPAAAIFRY